MLYKGIKKAPKGLYEEVAEEGNEGEHDVSSNTRAVINQSLPYRYMPR